MDAHSERVTGRFAPSPTGRFHLGNLRTAMLAWALARNAGGRFVLRMEDLDSARVHEEYVDAQLRELEALGIDWDGEILRQSANIERYNEAFRALAATGASPGIESADAAINHGALYECYCTRRELREVGQAPNGTPGVYPATCRSLTPGQREAGRAKLAGMNRGPAIRLRSDLEPVGEPGATHQLTVHDEILGDYTGVVDDMVIRRGEGEYAYNFVSVVDDAAQGVTDIVRGNDLLPSTPRQVYLQRLLGIAPPRYEHVPMVLNAEGIRLQKRDGAVTLEDLAEFGWTGPDVVDLLARSMGFAARSGDDFRSGLAELTGGEAGVRAIGAEPWLVDVRRLEDGPAAVLEDARC